MSNNCYLCGEWLDVMVTIFWDAENQRGAHVPCHRRVEWYRRLFPGSYLRAEGMGL